MTGRLRALVAGVALVVPLLTVTGTPATAAVEDTSYKIPSMLRQQAEQVSRLGAGKARQLTANAVELDQNGVGVQLYADGPVNADQENQLRSLGVTVKTNAADLAAVPGADLPVAGLVSTVVPVDKLDAVAALPWVSTLRPSLRPATDVGPNTAEAVQLHKADIAQQRGLTGKGQTVGVMSGDADHVAESIARGELPADTKILSQASYDNDEGTAMMEIVHDIAPDAKLMYATSGDTLADYVKGFHDLAAAGATIITEDLAFDDEPAFQQGLGATTAESLAKHGIWVSSSAGNLGNRHAPRVAAKGTGRTPDDQASAQTNCPAPIHNTVNLRGTDNTYNLNLLPGASLMPTLQWSEPRAIYPTTGQGGFTDLNLYLIDAAGNCLAWSNAKQANGVGDTLEQFTYTNTTGVAQAARLVVDVAGTSSARAVPTLDLRWRALASGVQTLDPTDRAGSLNPDSNYLGFATSAAATNASATVDPTTSPLEAYSAAGPVQLITTTQCPGKGIGPCKGVPGGHARTAPAPTYTATDGVQVSGVGPFGSGTCPAVKPGDCRFYGTSAATPSSAGVAALTRQEFGGKWLSPELLTFILKARAVHRDGDGWGAGVLSAT
ncbi:S8 family serine peptidase [Kutzneria sp. CA-103260]|uniref:S8 family serine peptidase n=1 Tax=Kutzneria sp. CA-103260 TaxID=2802641 RepID=UPI001BA674AC|nr:S8 family serine peptidase [Kutzneria sp. CA-103260]QUQ65022.1 Subtilase family protein [Kutzneria sp. CA-103260]